jgi:hypothetical protein
MRTVIWAFLRQYALRVLAGVSFGIFVLIAFLGVYSSVSPSPQCEDVFHIATNLQTGIVQSCSSSGAISDFFAKMMPLFCIAGLCLFLLMLGKGAKPQIIHRKQWSWFRIFIYVFYGLLLYISLTDIDFLSRVLILITSVLVALIYIVLYFYNRSRRARILNATFEYANTTIGTEDDLLDFARAAKNFRSGTETLNQPVQVIGITGGMGEGKSTYWRMIAEGLDKEKTLHTYISLTETNSTNDFSKLFSERWFETLKERYAFALSPSYSEESRLYRVLRDTGSGWLRLVAEAILTLNIGLFRTLTKSKDISYMFSEKRSGRYVEAAVAKVFNNIPELYEDRWFIVVDELERSPIAEVYRLIEVIERFRQFGKDGVPIQIIFVICYDASHFGNIDIDDEKVGLVKNFLTNTNRKSVDIVQKVPNPNLNRRIQLITDKLKSIIPKKVLLNTNYTFLDSLYDVEKDDFLDIRPEFGVYKKEYSFKETFDFLVLRMTSLPIRSTVRLITQQLKFFISALSNDKDEWLLNVNLSTFMAYEYIRLARPEFIPFIEASQSRFDPDLKSFYTLGQAFLGGFNEEEAKKRPIKEKILAATGIDVSLLSDEQIKAMFDELDILLPVVSQYLQEGGSDPYENNVVKYSGTLSDPDTLKWIIAFSKGEQTNFGRYTKLFDQIASRNLETTDFKDAQDLVDFSGFTRNRVGYTLKTSNKSLAIANTIYNYTTTVKGLVDPSSIQEGSSLLDSLTYEFVFQLHETAFGEVPEENKKAAADLFDEFMHNPVIKFEAKLIALDAFLKRDGSGFDRVRLREEVFDLYRGEDYFIKLYNELRTEIGVRYGKPKSPINIYNQEGNIFYVQYQFWSGVLEDPFLQDMRAMAKRGLTTNARGLLVLWNVYPYENGWKTYNDMLKSHDISASFFDPSRRGMYLKLEELLSYTRKNANFKRQMASDSNLRTKVTFWQAVHKEGSYTEREAKLEPSNDTVGAHIRDLFDQLMKKTNNGLGSARNVWEDVWDV